jgi:hypothetical protein
VVACGQNFVRCPAEERLRGRICAT